MIIYKKSLQIILKTSDKKGLEQNQLPSIWNYTIETDFVTIYTSHRISYIFI